MTFTRLLLFPRVVQSGETMLIGAVRGGHVEIVRALLNKYADIDVRGQVGAPFLFFTHEGGPLLFSRLVVIQSHLLNSVA